MIITPFAFRGPTAAGKGDPVLTNLEWWLDASRPTSYGGSGTTWTDIAPAGNGWNATLVGTPSHTSGDNGYFTWNGSSQYAEYNPGGNFNTDNASMTFELVYKVDDTITPAGTAIPFISRWGTNLVDQEFIFIREPSGGGQTKPFLLGTREGGEFDFVGSNVATTNTWQMYHIIYDYVAGTGDYNVQFFVNNVQVGATQTWPDYSFWRNGTGANVRIGHDYNSRYLGGEVAIVRYYSKALDSTERTTNYDLENAYYSFS